MPERRFPPPWRIENIGAAAGSASTRQAVAADVLRAFRRRCWCAITAQAQRMARSAGMSGMTARE